MALIAVMAGAAVMALIIFPTGAGAAVIGAMTPARPAIVAVAVPRSVAALLGTLAEVQQRAEVPAQHTDGHLRPIIVRGAVAGAVREGARLTTATRPASTRNLDI